MNGDIKHQYILNGYQPFVIQIAIHMKGLRGKGRCYEELQLVS